MEFSSRLNRGGDGDVEACLAEAFPNRHMPAVSAGQQKAALGDPPRLFAGLPVAKTMVEQPLSNQIVPGSAPSGIDKRPAAPTTYPSDSDKTPLAGRMTAEAWRKVAMLLREEARLHLASRLLIMKKSPLAPAHSEEQMSAEALAFYRMCNNPQTPEEITQDPVKRPRTTVARGLHDGNRDAA